jgi:hypothetical protein
VPYILRHRQVHEIVIPDADLDKLQRFRRARVVLCPNHPTNTDPALLFALSAQARMPFRYVASIETFEHHNRLWRWILPRLGAYSLVRGTMDRASFEASRATISEPGSKLVIFPEGEVYSQNESLLPFQEGVTQLAFWGLEDALEKDANADVILLPVALRYRFLNDMSSEIVDSMTRLESAIGLTLDPSLSVVPRLQRLANELMTRLEAQYSVPFDAELDFGGRMDRLKQCQLDRAAEIAGVKPKGDTLADQMRFLINTVFKVTKLDQRGRSQYDRRLWEQRKKHIEPALFELDRLANWIAVHDGYVTLNPTQERIVQVLKRMEVEVFGIAKIMGPQTAGIHLGMPISLRPHLEAYRSNRKLTVATITDQLEEAVLQELTHQ